MAAFFTLLLGVAAAMLWHLLTGMEGQLPQESYLQFRQWVIIIFGLMAAVVVVSFAISFFVVSRINRIALTAHDIVAVKDLSRRIAIDTQWDDLSNLAQLLNQFLEQLETLMTGVREVSNNIAHDLRTPLAGLRSDIESLKGGHVEDHHLDALIAETDKILGIFQSLLRIANIEQGKRAHAFAAVDMRALLKDVVELYEPVAEEKNVTLQTQLTSSLLVSGDADLLFQLFANLLDNAVKFSPYGERIVIEAMQERGWVVVCICDHGVGIPEVEKERVFKHFYRGDASRSTQGNGLGLSLVKAVVRQHLGQIALEDGKPGLRVRVMLQPYQ
jgi:signal transduction histidine kinase